MIISHKRLKSFIKFSRSIVTHDGYDFHYLTNNLEFPLTTLMICHYYFIINNKNKYN